MDNRWWNASVWLNGALGGDDTEPLCSRVYRMEDSIFRSAYMAAMDILFSEKGHCERVFFAWVTK